MAGIQGSVNLLMERPPQWKRDFLPTGNLVSLIMHQGSPSLWMRLCSPNCTTFWHFECEAVLFWTQISSMTFLKAVRNHLTEVGHQCYFVCWLVISICDVFQKSVETVQLTYTSVMKLNATSSLLKLEYLTLKPPNTWLMFEKKKASVFDFYNRIGEVFKLCIYCRDLNYDPPPYR